MLLSDRHASYKEFLEKLRDMTEDDLREAVTALPESIRSRLAAGPIARRYSCGICEAFGKDFYVSGWRDADPSDSMWRVFGYHEVLKIEMVSDNQLYYGPLANEIYERCIATYRAAGWNEEAEAADA